MQFMHTRINVISLQNKNCIFDAIIHQNLIESIRINELSYIDKWNCALIIAGDNGKLIEIQVKVKEQTKLNVIVIRVLALSHQTAANLARSMKLAQWLHTFCWTCISVWIDSFTP